MDSTYLNCLQLRKTYLSDRRFNQSNDLFRLTVQQFERVFQPVFFIWKILIESNRTLNVCEDILVKLENIVLYRTLTALLGSEKTIRLRQKMFIIQDIINGYGDIDSVSVSSGSLAEGIHMKGSDEDIMLILKDVLVFENDTDLRLPPESSCALVKMETTDVNPGFARLFLVADPCSNEYLQKAIDKDTNESNLLSSTLFRRIFAQPGQDEHGPCVSDGVFDFAICLHSRTWPGTSRAFLERDRPGAWPSKTLIDALLNDGCILVPVGPRRSQYYNILWRISFSVAERRLILSFNHTQFMIYGLLKIILKEYIEQQNGLKDLLCSYFLKTALFFTIECTRIEWTPVNIFTCLRLCLDRIVKWVHSCYCPNYFIPENNMFVGKVDKQNNSQLLQALDLIRDGHVECFFLRLRSFQENVDSSYLSFTHSKTLEAIEEAQLDLLCYRVMHIYPFDSKHIANLAALKAEELIERENDIFLRGILLKYRASIHQELAQMTKPSGRNKSAYEAMKLQKLHILHGGSPDLTCFHLHLASMYYRQGQYYKARDVVNYMISRIPSFVLNLRSPEYTATETEMYRKSLCGRGYSLGQKRRSATIQCAIMLDESSLIPPEFLPEVQFYRPLFMFPPLVLAYALLFLSNTILRNKDEGRDAFENLKHVVQNEVYVNYQHSSNASVVLGVCQEIIGNVEEAITNYELALEKPYTCKSAKKRLENLRKRQNSFQNL